jgi:hypothetical protein
VHPARRGEKEGAKSSRHGHQPFFSIASGFGFICLSKVHHIRIIVHIRILKYLSKFCTLFFFIYMPVIALL